MNRHPEMTAAGASRGFTFLETLIALLILGVLAAVLAQSYHAVNAANDRAREIERAGGIIGSVLCDAWSHRSTVLDEGVKAGAWSVATGVVEQAEGTNVTRWTQWTVWPAGHPEAAAEAFVMRPAASVRPR